MFDDLAAYFQENVVAAFEEYLAIKRSVTTGRSRDIRTATAAAAALFHLREHLPPASALSRSDAERLCPDYGVLGDIANVAKHRSLTAQTPHGPPLIALATQLREMITVTEYEDEAGQYRHVDKRVMAELSNGDRRDVLDIMISVMNFWQRHLHALGVIPRARTFQSLALRQPMSRSECGSDRLNIEVLQGLRLHQTIQLLRYNYVTGAIEPVDLTGMEACLRIYKPSYSVDVSLTHDATGASLMRSVSLSDEESRAMAMLDSEAEREAYAGSLECVRQMLKQLAIELGPLPRAGGATAGT